MSEELNIKAYRETARGMVAGNSFSVRYGGKAINNLLDTIEAQADTISTLTQRNAELVELLEEARDALGADDVEYIGAIKNDINQLLSNTGESENA